jgi:hypothetical protein
MAVFLYIHKKELTANTPWGYIINNEK